MGSLVAKNSFALVRIRVFSLSRLWLFILGLILAALAASATSSFLLGVSEKDFFLEDREDVLVIKDPASTTPVTGRVPTYLASDIAQLHGVKGVSSEILGYCIIDNHGRRPIAFRGITQSFFEVENVRVIKGQISQAFIEDGDRNIVREAILGHQIAQHLDIQVGDWLVISSSLVDVRTTIKISGIVKTGTPSDAELLIPFTLANMLADVEPATATLIRVAISLKETSKENIQSILNSVFSVTIVATVNQSETSEAIKGARIGAITPYGQLVESKILEENNSVIFNLPFGTYDFFVSQEGMALQTVRLLVQEDTYLAIDLQPPPLYELQVHVLRGKDIVEGANVSIARVVWGIPLGWSELHLSVPANGTVRFGALPQGTYRIMADIANLTQVKHIQLTASTTIEINLYEKVIVEVRNATIETFPVVDAHIKLISTISGMEWANFTNQTGMNLFYVPADIYEISTSYNTYEAKFDIQISNDSYFQVFLGIGKVHVEVVDQSGTPYGANTNVTIKSADGERFENVTDHLGQTSISLAVGQKILISANTENYNNSMSLFFMKSSNVTLTLYKKQSYSLPVQVIERVTQQPLENVAVEIENDEGQVVASQLTDTMGLALFQLPGPKHYQIHVSGFGFKDEHGFNLFENLESPLVIQFGAYQQEILCLTAGSYLPIPNATVAVFANNSQIENGITDFSGLVTFYLPAGYYSVGVSHHLWASDPVYEDLAVYSASPPRIIRHLYMLSDLTLRIKDSQDNYLVGAQIELIPLFSLPEGDSLPKGITDDMGEARWENITWGSYKVEIFYLGFSYTKTLLLNGTHNFESDYELAIQSQSLAAFHPERWVHGVEYSVSNSREHVAGFFKTSLISARQTFAGVTLTVTLVVTASIFSLVDYPVNRTKEEIQILVQIGSSRTQIVLGLSIQLLVVGGFSLLIGSFLGMFSLQWFYPLQNALIGTIIVNPVFSWVGILVVTLVAEAVVAIACVKALILASRMPK
ncbi:MAG: ABC transporter permease [Candidatus Heimdallarchaeota archaeon]